MADNSELIAALLSGVKQPTDEDYLANPEPEAPGDWWRRQVSGFGGGLMNPLGMTGAALKAMPHYLGSYSPVSPEKADLFDRVTKEQMSQARPAAGLGAGIPLGAALGPIALAVRYGGLPLSYLLREVPAATGMGMAVGTQVGSIWDNHANDGRPPDAQARYRRGGY